MDVKIEELWYDIVSILRLEEGENFRTQPEDEWPQAPQVQLWHVTRDMWWAVTRDTQQMMMMRCVWHFMVFVTQK